MNIEKFLVPENAKLKLAEHATDFTDDYTEKKQAEKDLEKNVERLAKLQDVLWADNRHALLIIFQAMDAAGKDGAIKHVMSGLNPQGVHVSSFKQPSAEELDHDYLWRSMKQLPNAGASEFLTVRITKTFSSSAFIRRFCRANNCRKK